MDLPDVTLRLWRPQEAPRLFDLLSRVEVTRWFGSASRAPLTDVEQARQRITQWALDFDEPLGTRAIVAADRAAPVGSVLLFRAPNALHGEIEVGWYLHPDATGRGYAAAGARQAVLEAFAAGHPEVWALTHTDNHPSRATAARIGMRDLGVVDGLWHEGPSQLFVVSPGTQG
ncbi:GNAT family N-acetyltransferase [Kineococcus sp. SYSU DK003]|uniref:GNAT family N-acetyltransferase n=1 Tax=Kineococcus sp. SYSU DK003 TaxID=3383124 RepID=UPI003D7D483D